MKILAPIDGPEQVPLTIGAGAKEIYCGYIPDDWRYTYNRNGGPVYPIQISPNRRESPHSNLIRIEQLQKVVRIAHAKDVSVYVTVNAPYYPDSCYPYMLDFCRHILDQDVDGLIIADPGLIMVLREKGISTTIILSTCTQTASIPAVRFFQQIGVNRITFPRHISLREIEQITSSVPDMGYEVFILEGRCTYDDGNCHILHCGGSFCMDEFIWDLHKTGNKKLSWQEIKQLRRHVNTYRRWTYPFANDIKNSQGWRNMGCGICALPFFLHRTKITAVKLAGRGIDNLQKLKSLWLLKKAFTLANGGAGPMQIRSLLESMPDCQEECQLGTRCYFPDWRQEVNESIGK